MIERTATILPQRDAQFGAIEAVTAQARATQATQAGATQAGAMSRTIPVTKQTRPGVTHGKGRYEDGNAKRETRRRVEEQHITAWVTLGKEVTPPMRISFTKAQTRSAFTYGKGKNKDDQYIPAAKNVSPTTSSASPPSIPPQASPPGGQISCPIKDDQLEKLPGPEKTENIAAPPAGTIPEVKVTPPTISRTIEQYTIDRSTRSGVPTQVESYPSPDFLQSEQASSSNLKASDRLQLPDRKLARRHKVQILKTCRNNIFHWT